MRTFREIKANYYFTTEDEIRLVQLRSIMEQRVDRVVDALYQWVNATDSAKKVFKSDSLIKHVMKLVRLWFINLFQVSTITFL